MGVLLAYAGFLPLQELMVSQANGATRTGHLTLASPAVLLKNGLGFALAVGSVPATTTWTWISLGVLVFGAVALAAWVFLRAQGVETWEATRGQRWTIGLAIVALGAAPQRPRGHELRQAGAAQNSAPAIRGLFARAGSSLALVEAGRRGAGTLLQHDSESRRPHGDGHGRRDQTRPADPAARRDIRSP